MLFIEFLLLAGGFPERNQVEVFALGIVPYLENQRVQLGPLTALAAGKLQNLQTLPNPTGFPLIFG
jgi:hypothetical protein